MVSRPAVLPRSRAGHHLRRRIVTRWDRAVDAAIYRLIHPPTTRTRT